MDWDPQKYVEFSDYRNVPFFDLTARITGPEPRLVVDLGCGPGNLTATLARRWPGAHVIGLDSSGEMVRQARRARGEPNLEFIEGDIAGWTPPRGLDVLISNAALHWVPGHLAMMRRWLQQLQPGAWLAVQVPDNFDAPSHALMRALADSPRWSARLAGVLRHDNTVGSVLDYLRLLLEEGCEAQAWTTIYEHVLHDQDPVLEWVRGAGLRPVLAALAAEEAREFEAEFARLLRQAYPATPYGTVYSFRRIFAVGCKKGPA
ncbi:trans-aconitate 2-methyltransferase [Arthrobacter sp. GCM10027362]|uniref:trans-aconitate 2-methyltransferase n=1 Tax=Arthrobacter sp. GCM10027362 TaxID=3273379 RepID=UPI00363779F4